MRRSWVLADNSATLLVTLFIASCAYAVLSATTESSRLAVRGTVATNAATAAYDLIVRAPGTRSAVEESTDLVQPGFASAVDGGISLDQWHIIEGVRGVEVAAPVAVVGWVVPYVNVPTDLSDLEHLKHPVVIRRTTTWSYDNGASTVSGAPELLYVTPNPVELDTSGYWVETRPDDSVARFPLPQGNIPTTLADTKPTLFVASTHDLRGPDRDPTNADVLFPFPFLLAAVDPAAEARLTGVDQALVDGDWLSGGAPKHRMFHTRDGREDERTAVPVAVAAGPLVRLSASYHLDAVTGPAVRELARNGLSGDVPSALTEQSGTELAAGSFDQDDAYESLLTAMATPDDDGAYYARSVLKLQRTAPLEISVGGTGTLTPKLEEENLLGWGSPSNPGDVAESIVPAGGDDATFRHLEGYFVTPGTSVPPPALVKVGVFDAAKLPGTTSLARVPLGTFAFSAATGADKASRATLSDEGWFPSTNITGYPSQPPMMLTSLDSLPAFQDEDVWGQPGTGGTFDPGFPPVSSRPISAVRVRVDDVDGVTALDRERVRTVAEAITEETGLEVDITMGSSPSAQDVTVAAGKHGRPALHLSELWVKKGVAVALIRSIDRASLLLSLVVLAAGGLVVGDTVFATVRARRREIGILLMVGWRPRDIGLRVMLPVLGSALLAGTFGAVAAWCIRLALDLDANVAGVLVAVPAAVLVAGVAAAWPAVVAARSSPLAAMRAPAARLTRRRTRLRSVTGLAWRSVLVSPGRTVAAVTGVATATAALGSVIAVQVEFRGRAVGTLLGDAVAVQVRTPDVAAAALTLLLAGLGVHHVMATEVRERGSELAMMRASGWRDYTIARLLLTQAAFVALIGGLVGSAAAWWFLGVVFDSRSTTMVLALLGATGGAVLLAVLVTLPAVRRVRAIPLGLLLAED